MKRKLAWLATPLLLACVNLGEAQQPKKVARVGILISGSPSSQSGRVEAFRTALRELGYEEGNNIEIEERRSERGKLNVHAAELVHRNVHVVLTSGTSSTQAIREATNTVPIVMTFVSDPVGFGFVSSLSRPGGNVTGLTNLAPDLAGKWLELLKDISPRTAEVAVLLDPTVRVQSLLFKEMQIPAKTLRINLSSLDFKPTEQRLESLSETLNRRRVDGLITIVPASSSFQRRRIIEIAANRRLPTIYHWREYVDDGGLAFYGASLTEMYRRAAVYVDKILRGAKPGELPVEQPKKFEFIVNLKTAKQIGLTIPPHVLARADRVIK